MNHLRQQGAGNVSAMLYMGKKVYLNEANPLFDFYRKLGVRIFSIDELKKDPKLLGGKLTESEISNNREILKERICWNTAIKKTKNLIRTVMERDS